MLPVSTASRVVSGARRAVVVAGQRRTVQAIYRTSVRGIQSIAQTDRVS
jgi:N-acetyl-gamma-glutamyl-phosphate reductase / acetylglutamate kinase